MARSVTFGYDAGDRVTTQTLPDARTIRFGYDANSNVTSLTPPGRPAHTFTYTPGLYPPTSGRILYDGIPLPELEYESVRHRMGVVPQALHLLGHHSGEHRVGSS